MKAATYVKEAPIAVITFNRPEVLNAYNFDLMNDLITAFESARQDPEVRVIVWKGNGRAWSAGADIKLIAQMRDTGGLKTFRDFMMLEEESTRVIMKLRKPIIAAIHGYAVGGGCEYAMLADIRIATEGAQFGFPETSMGGVITHASTKILSQLVGLSKAKELVLTGEMIDAYEAERIGLVNKVVRQEELDKVVIGMAEKIADSPSLAQCEMKYAIDHGFEWDYESALKYESIVGLLAMACGDMTKGYSGWAKGKERQ